MQKIAVRIGHGQYRCLLQREMQCMLRKGGVESRSAGGSPGGFADAGVLTAVQQDARGE